MANNVNSTEASGSLNQTKEVNTFAESWKTLGNNAFKVKDYPLAIKHFTQAIEIDPLNPIYYSNRSLAYASQLDWLSSAQDAKEAIKLDSKFNKGHFRLVKAFLALNKIRDARQALVYAFHECGEVKEFKELEDEIFQLTNIPVRPKSTDFEIMEEIGDGNFSKVYKTYLKSTKEVFAIKTMEKTTIDRMKKRHPNIHNEILMEKRILNKINHPGIVTLISTFQDYGTLYFQMEYLNGHDLWTFLHDVRYESVPNPDNPSELYTKKIVGAQLGLPWSMLRFYMNEMINVLEYLHRKGIVHRDLKPENIIVQASGHLKFIDFGTAKDLIQTDLNGQEFVGTPEYMSPDTIEAKKGTNVGIDADLWSLGIILYQLLLGATPFHAPSPYLNFLRTKRSYLQIPSFVPQPIASMIQLLLQKDVNDRIQSSTGLDPAVHNLKNAEVLSALSYDNLRSHAFFTQWTQEVVIPRHSFYASVLKVPQERILSAVSFVEDCDSLAYQREIYQKPAIRVSSLHDLCIRAVGEAVITASFEISNNGGIKPKIPWIQNLDLVSKITESDSKRIQIYLEKKQKLHLPLISRFFQKTLPQTRCKRLSPMKRDHVAMTHGLQGHWVTIHNTARNTVDNTSSNYFFSAIANPNIVKPVEGSEECFAVKELKGLIAMVNKLRPKFLVIIGNFISSCPSTILDNEEKENWYHMQMLYFTQTISRVSDTIHCIFVPGPNDVSLPSTPSSRNLYNQYFASSFYGFYYNGYRYLVLDSSWMITTYLSTKDTEGSNEICLDKAFEEYETWLEEEIEQNKLCSQGIIMFSYHPWYYEHMDEDDREDQYDQNNQFLPRNIPKELRQKWLPKLRHHKVKYLVSSVNRLSNPSPAPLRPFAKKQSIVEDIVQQESEPMEESEELPTEESVQDITNDNEDAKSDTSEEFLNEEDNYDGPELLFAPPVAIEGPIQTFPTRNILFSFVQENQVEYKYFADDSSLSFDILRQHKVFPCPKSIQELQDSFQETK